jgi:hypothetical protein
MFVGALALAAGRSVGTSGSLEPEANENLWLDKYLGDQRRQPENKLKAASSSAAINNDPFFVVRGEKTHFWLPVHTATPLLMVDSSPGPEFALTGETFGDDRASQWFKSYELKVAGNTVVRVRVGIPAEQKTLNEERSLKTMQLWVSGQEFRGSLSGSKLFAPHGITIHARQLPDKKIVGHPAEEVTVLSQALNLTIWSSPARKRGFDASEEEKFAHLNLDLNWMKGRAKGLVAELAGESDISRSTKLLLQPPPGFSPKHGIDHTNHKKTDTMESKKTRVALMNSKSRVQLKSSAHNKYPAAQHAQQVKKRLAGFAASSGISVRKQR